ncbi:seed maturation protein PM37 [Hibiscus syriacus]|uniref:Seed maturation protein PM37 n=1 Tax=Hibiscus syriacus TaxID=106335 RepID=A0A6A3D8L2_HIBSY|nr:seed maturation protein PM37 [Hibiscus syriacus]
MGKITCKKLKGSQNMRQSLLLATLKSTPILIDDIHADDSLPGLRPHEISLLHLFEKLSDDCVVEINETGTKLKYKPGIIIGGSNLAHDCGVSRAIGYFLEPLIFLGLFGLKLELKRRGVSPHCGGEVHLTIPTVQHRRATMWTMKEWLRESEGKLSLPDSPGYGISLVAETTSGCCMSTDTTVSYGGEAEDIEGEDKKGPIPAADVGEKIASVLLEEIEIGGVAGSTHQRNPLFGLLFLCALCPKDVSKVRVGKLSPYGIETLRQIKDILDVQFVIKPDPSTGTVILKRWGSGMKNLSRKTT